MNDLSSPHSVTRHNTKGLRKSCGPRNFVAAWKSVGRGMFVVALGTLGLVGGCSGGKERPGLTDSMGGSGSIIDKSCTPREKRQCGFTLHQQGGIKTCYRGVEHCNEDGKWGECEDGEVTREPDLSYKEFSAAPPSFNKWQALSDVPAEDCEEACDPKCMHFIEGTPDLGMPPIVGEESTPFPGVMGPMCAHGLCTTGAPLNADCDPCVNTICNLTAYGRPPDSACCTTGWDSECVDQVYTKCLNTPPPVKFGLCDFGVYALDGLVTANRPSSGAAIGSIGNVTVGTDASPGRIVTKGNLHINAPNGKQITTPGGVWVGGNATAQNGGGAQYIGDWHVGGSIALSGGNAIIGNVYAGSTPTGVAISGGTAPNPHVPTPAPDIQIPTVIPPLPAGSCPSAGATSPSTSGGVLTITPGSYNTVTMSNNSKLVLNGPGTYIINTLDANVTGGGIQVGTPTNSTGDYTVIVCNNFRLGNGANIIGSTASIATTVKLPLLTDPARLVMYVGGNVNFDTDANFTGVLSVPNGTFTASNNNCKPTSTCNAAVTAAVTRFNGFVWAKNFNVGTDFNALPVDASVCEGLNIPGTGPGEGGLCPVIPTAGGSLPPSTLEPCRSGLDCQMNQRCTEAVTAAACTHSKCVPGAALVKACDPCVSKICDAKASCCTGPVGAVWDQSCVDMVPTYCDASCGAFTGCAHDVCAAGSRLVQGCDTGAPGSGNCTQAVCSNAMYAYCCDPNSAQGWNAACVTRAKTMGVCTGGTPSGMATPSACEVAVAGNNNINPNASVTTSCPAGATNALCVRSNVAGTVTAKTITGYTGTCGAGDTSVTTNTSYNAASRGNVTVSNNATLTLNAGTHNINNLTFAGWSGSRLVTTGNVTLNICGNLDFGGRNTGDTAILNVSAGNLTINVRGNVSFGQASATSISGNANVTMNVYGTTTIVSQATFAVTTSGIFAINSHGNVEIQQQANMTAPAVGANLLRFRLHTNGTLTLGPGAATRGALMSVGAATMNGGTLYGALWSSGNVALNNMWNWPTIQNTIPSASCTTAALVPPAAAACPVTTPGPVFSGDDDGLCVSNEDGWTQPSCAGFDLALGYVCGSTVPVCNHGSVPFPGGTVRVGYYSIEDSPKFAIESPGTATGTCNQVLPAIPPGACQDLSCNIPTGKDYTVMVDPNDALNECSRLDNWSWRDDDFACGGGPAGDTFVEYEYKAVCPKDSSALWKNITWISTVPADSSISFSAKVGECDTEVEDDHRQLPDQLCYPGKSDYDDCVDDCLERLRSTGDPYTLLGVSELAPVDTTTCSLTEGGSNCPVALTDQLDLSANQGQFLLLRVETDFAGGTPTMEDWTVSYTCQYDQ